MTAGPSGIVGTGSPPSLPLCPQMGSGSWRPCQGLVGVRDWSGNIPGGEFLLHSTRHWVCSPPISSIAPEESQAIWGRAKQRQTFQIACRICLQTVKGGVLNRLDMWTVLFNPYLNEPRVHWAFNILLQYVASLLANISTTTQSDEGIAYLHKLIRSLQTVVVVRGWAKVKVLGPAQTRTPFWTHKLEYFCQFICLPNYVSPNWMCNLKQWYTGHFCGNSLEHCCLKGNYGHF